MSENSIPADLRYTREHEWIQRTAPDTVRVGITDFAQSALGDVVFVQLPEGGEVTAGDSFGEVESTKSVSDIFAPIAGTIVATNDALGDAPETINSAPYGDGWLVEIKAADEATLDAALAETLDAAAYEEFTAGQ